MGSRHPGNVNRKAGRGHSLLLALGVVAANFLNDLLYPLLDPRVRQARAAA